MFLLVALIAQLLLYVSAQECKALEDESVLLQTKVEVVDPTAGKARNILKSPKPGITQSKKRASITKGLLHAQNTKRASVTERLLHMQNRKRASITQGLPHASQKSSSVAYNQIPPRCRGLYAVASQSRTNMSRADQVRDAIRHYWTGYKKAAWGSDEVQPISGYPMPKSAWGDIGMNILDTLDTLWLAGMHKEFAEGESFVAGLRFDAGKETSYRTSFFETTIRALGGLLSSYALSGHRVFLEKATELGRSLRHAFPEGPRKLLHFWPAAYLNVRRPSDIDIPGWRHKAVLAEAGSNILEFDYLAEAAGDDSLRVDADANEARLLGLAQETKQHLARPFMEVQDFKYIPEDGEATIGTFADSYFEYLLKGYIQSGGSERQLLDEWKQAMQQMRNTLVRKSKGGLTYIAQGRFSTTMDHLSCFMGGLLALGSHYVAEDERENWWLPLGADITESCYEMYRQSPSGIAPEAAEFGATVVPTFPAKGHIRPETLESLFYLYRITGNETYRHWSWEIFDAINKHTRTNYGFGSVKDTTCMPVPLEDREETFVGAETLKYALLINLPESTLPLDHFVLNTEAHPVPIQHGLKKARIKASEGIIQANAIEANIEKIIAKANIEGEY